MNQQLSLEVNKMVEKYVNLASKKGNNTSSSYSKFDGWMHNLLLLVHIDKLMIKKYRIKWPSKEISSLVVIPKRVQQVHFFLFPRVPIPTVEQTDSWSAHLFFRARRTVIHQVKSFVNCLTWMNLFNWSLLVFEKVELLWASCTFTLCSFAFCLTILAMQFRLFPRNSRRLHYYFFLIERDLWVNIWQI